MSNEKVVLRFLEGKEGHTPTRDILNGVYVYKGQTLKTNGRELINYSTRIAYIEKGVLHLNTKRYSVTTSKIQNNIRRLASERGFTIKEYQE